MIPYFGYGSNIDATSMRAKGVVPARSVMARLPGWRLTFEVEHFFRHEGGMGHIRQTGADGDAVLGVLHLCSDADLAALDTMEAYGIGYDRIDVVVQAKGVARRALAYVGLPDFLNPACQPTRRYLNILARGARAAGFDPAYIRWLDGHDILAQPDLPAFAPPPGRCFAMTEVAASTDLVVLCDHVFDMATARPRHAYIRDFMGGRDITLFQLDRADVSHGGDTLDDVRAGRISDAQRAYLNRYLHAFAEEYRHVGTLIPNT